MKFATHIIATLLVVAGTTAAETWDLYYLGGQSNMDGYGTNTELPAELNRPVDGVMIFHGNTSPDNTPVDGRGIWSKLRPGHGVGFKSDGKSNQYSKRFGAELTFARRLREINPEGKIAIVKYSRGGTSIDQRAAGGFGCWEPDFLGGEGVGEGVNQYDHFLATVRFALADVDIDDDGERDTLVPKGICWMQGESDATRTAEIAELYKHNLKRLIDLIRAAWHVDDLPVAIGRISDSGRNDAGKVWAYGPEVRAAQAAFRSGRPGSSAGDFDRQLQLFRSVALR